MTKIGNDRQVKRERARVEERVREKERMIKENLIKEGIMKYYNNFVHLKILIFEICRFLLNFYHAILHIHIVSLLCFLYFILFLKLS